MLNSGKFRGPALIKIIISSCYNSTHVCSEKPIQPFSPLRKQQIPKGRHSSFIDLHGLMMVPVIVAFLHLHKCHSLRRWKACSKEPMKRLLLKPYKHKAVTLLYYHGTIRQQHNTDIEQQKSNPQTRAHVFSCTLSCQMRNQTNIHQGNVHCWRQLAN